MRKQIAILIMAVTASLGTVTAAVPVALASTSATPAMASRTAAYGPGLRLVRSASAAVNICLTNDPTECLESNGGGNQVTITGNQANYAGFHQVNQGSSPGIQLENASGNCLRAGTNNVVKIENGPCDAQDTADSWQRVNGRFQSFLYGDYMLTHGHTSGLKVWHDMPRPGDYVEWNVPL